MRIIVRETDEEEAYGVAPGEYRNNPAPVVLRTLIKPFDCYLLGIGYFDFWQKQSGIPGQDCETICGLLDSIKGKLDDIDGSDANAADGCT